jgi:site-specific DNA recombinase
MSPTSKPALPIDIYCRVSQTRGREGDSFQSVDQQLDRCRRQLAADGLAEGEVFEDLDQSGGKTSRPQFDLMMERVRTGKSGGVVVHDLTRFGRYETMARDIIALEESGALFLSCAEKIDTTTSSGRFFLRVMEAMAVMYREQARERVGVSQANAVERGVHISRFVPPGYVKGLDGILAPHTVHAATLRAAYGMAAEGADYARIATFLTERGFPSGADRKNPEGRPATWHASRIRRLLENPVYRGQARYGQHVHEGAHEAIVDAETWAVAQRRPTPHIRRDAVTLLAGRVRCHACMHSMVGTHSSKHVDTYECRGNGRPGEKCPRPVAISMRRLEEYVLDELTARLQNTPRGIEVEVDAAAGREALADARAALAEVEAMKSELRPAAYAVAYDVALEGLEAAEAALSAVTTTPHIMEETLLTLEALGDKEARRSLIGEEIGNWRQVIAEYLQAVVVSPAASRSNRAPVSERVRLVWADEPKLELPKRGARAG